MEVNRLLGYLLMMLVMIRVCWLSGVTVRPISDQNAGPGVNRGGSCLGILWRAQWLWDFRLRRQCWMPVEVRKRDTLHSSRPSALYELFLYKVHTEQETSVF